MAAPKGYKPPNAGKGRQAGVPNKMTRDLREMILQALDKAGGVKYLQEQAKASPAAFLTLVGKVLPTTLTGDPNAPMRLAVAVYSPTKDPPRDVAPDT